jgi:hypothetical protein
MEDSSKDNKEVVESASSSSSSSLAVSILTVGDGDLSCSLAIQRAYGGMHRLVATTILSDQQDLLQTYESSSAQIIIEELESSSEILYGVDATQLHKHPDLCQRKFDLILFHHPHLGYNNNNKRKTDNNNTDDDDDNAHATRHACLLAHYFDSARYLLSDQGTVHVCLCSGAVHSWKLDDVVERLNLEYLWDSPRAASRPLLEYLDEPTPAACTTTNNNTKGNTTRTAKRHRAGGRKGHWLGKYGYRHRPTFPATTDFQTNVSNSYHYFLRPKGPRKLEATDEAIRCRICRQMFESSDELEAHELKPALPIG